MCMCTCTKGHLDGVLYFQVDFRDLLLVMFGSKHLYPLGHCTSPKRKFLLYFSCFVLDFFKQDLMQSRLTSYYGAPEPHYFDLPNAERYMPPHPQELLAFLGQVYKRVLSLNPQSSGFVLKLCNVVRTIEQMETNNFGERKDEGVLEWGRVS